jgi:hypothetical protein
MPNDSWLKAENWIHGIVSWKNSYTGVGVPLVKG